MGVVVRGGNREVIATAWYALGFRPRRSLVAVALHGARQRIGVVVRVDLPGPVHRAECLGRLARTLRQDGADGAVVLVVADDVLVAGGSGAAGSRGADDRAAGDGAGEGTRMRKVIRAAPDAHAVDDPPASAGQAWVSAVLAVLPSAGIRVADVVGVGESRYRSLLPVAGRGDPSRSKSLTEATASEVALHHVVAGHVLAQDETDLLADVRADPDLLREGVPAPPPLEAVDRGWAWSTWRQALPGPALPESVRSGPALPEREVARKLAHALVDVRFRDAVMVSLVPGASEAASALVSGGVPDLGALMATPPDPALAESGHRLLAALARAADPADRVHALAVLAWLSWWTGDGVRARLLAGSAADADPDHRLAGLVRRLLAAAVPPPWAGPSPRFPRRRSRKIGPPAP